MIDKPKSAYSQHGDTVQHRVTKVPANAAGARSDGPRASENAHPESVRHDVGTPVQPIIIHVPAPHRDSGPKTMHHAKTDWLHFIAAVLSSIIIASISSLYVVSRFLSEYSNRIDKLDARVEDQDVKVREMDNKLTRIDTQVNFHD